MRFMDSDRCIEKEAGKPITAIFEESGEAGFRQLEREFIESGHPTTGVVVSCGGGLPTPPGMPELLLSRGVVICLFARPETVLSRTAGNPKRPLLNVANPEKKIRELMAEREPCYMRTGIGISAEGRTIHEVVSNVIRVYRRNCHRPGRKSGASGDSVAALTRDRREGSKCE